MAKRIEAREHGMQRQLSYERIHQSLTEFGGSRKDAAIAIGVSTDCLRIAIRRYRDQGFKFPKPQNEKARLTKCAENLQPGQWVEAGKDQECGEILAIEGERALVEFQSGRNEWLAIRLLAWVPSGDVIADMAREIRDNWPPGERRKRARWAHTEAVEVVRCAVEEDSRDDIW